MRRGHILLLLLASLCALWVHPSSAQPPAVAGHLFAIDTQYPAPALRRFTADGTNILTQPLPAATLPEGLAYDDVAKLVYWVEASHSGARIRRTGPGLGPGTTILSGLGSLRGIAVDPAGGQMFWTASDQGTGALISRASLNGSNVQVLFQLFGFNPREIAVDRVHGKVYWTEFEFDGIARCGFDGSNGEWVAFFPPGSRPYGIAINEATQELFWTQYGTGTVEKMPLPPAPVTSAANAAPGEAATLAERSAALVQAARAARPLGARSTAALLGGLSNPTHLTLDPVNGKMFISQAGVGVQSIRRANLDGSDAVTLPVPQGAFGGIVSAGTSLLDAPEPEPQPVGVALSLTVRNPARSGAELSFGLPASGPVRLRILDAAGRVVATVADGEHAAGPHRVTWTGQTTSGRAAPGMYVARLETAGRPLTRRFAYLK